MGNAVEDQQVSCLWQGEYLLSVSVSGNINYLDRNNPDKPLRVLTGHNKNITALTSYNKGTTIYSASFDGRVDILFICNFSVSLNIGPIISIMS